MVTPDQDKPILPPVTGDGAVPRIIETMSPELRDIVRGLIDVQVNRKPPVVETTEVPEPRIVSPRILEVAPRIVRSRVAPPREPKK